MPLPEALQARLGLPAPVRPRRIICAGAARLIARRNPPPLDAVDAAFEGYDGEIAALRREGVTRDLPGDAVERFFALGFALDQLHRDFRDLEQRVTEYAGSTMGTGK